MHLMPANGFLQTLGRSFVKKIADLAAPEHTQRHGKSLAAELPEMGKSQTEQRGGMKAVGGKNMNARAGPVFAPGKKSLIS